MHRPSTAPSILNSLPLGSKILIVRLRSIGDIILLTPALRLLKEWRADLRVSVAVDSRFRGLLENNPDVDEVLEPGGGAGLRKLTARIGALRTIRRHRFDLCVNLHGGPTSATLTSWSGAPRKIGFEHFRRRALYDLLVPDARTILNQATIHTAEHQASAFFYLGLPRTEIPRARIFVTSSESQWWAGKRTELELPAGNNYAVIHPTALYATKQWLPERFAALGQHLEAERKLPVLYSCGPGEQTVLDAIARAVGRQIRRLEGASLRQFAAALAAARLFVGNDSGPAHMAAALGRPGVVLFGSSSSTIWGPWRPAAPWRVVQNHYDCNPCPGDRCYQFTRPECILSITDEQVRSAVAAVLAGTFDAKGK